MYFTFSLQFTSHWKVWEYRSYKEKSDSETQVPCFYGFPSGYNIWLNDVNKLFNCNLFFFEIFTEPEICHKYSYGVRAVVQCIPAWLRFIQCLRRYRDTKRAFPHLVNAGKYSTTFFMVTFAALYSTHKGILWLRKGFFLIQIFTTWICFLFCVTFPLVLLFFPHWSSSPLSNTSLFLNTILVSLQYLLTGTIKKIQNHAE